MLSLSRMCAYVSVCLCVYVARNLMFHGSMTLYFMNIAFRGIGYSLIYDASDPPSRRLGGTFVNSHVPEPGSRTKERARVKVSSGRRYDRTSPSSSPPARTRCVRHE